MRSGNEADSSFGHMTLMTSRCNVRRQIHYMQSETAHRCTANDLVNLPYQWCSNFHRVVGDAISLKHQCSPVSSVSVPIAQ